VPVLAAGILLAVWRWACKDLVGPIVGHTLADLALWSVAPRSLSWPGRRWSMRLRPGPSLPASMTVSLRPRHITSSTRLRRWRRRTSRRCPGRRRSRSSTASCSRAVPSPRTLRPSWAGCRAPLPLPPTAARLSSASNPSPTRPPTRTPSPSW